VQCDYGELLGKAAIFLTEIFKGTGWREQLLTVKQFLLGDLNPGYCMEELSVSSAGDEWVWGLKICSKQLQLNAPLLAWKI
jgi:hypothetical protein